MVENEHFAEKTAHFMQSWVDAYVAFVKQNNQ